ncbi:MAG: hypothetical protein ACO1Q7_15000 [Gemmatimonas sp.]
MNTKALLRSILMYGAMAVGVTVGGVVVGAMVVAPAVSRTTPLLERTLSKTASNRRASTEESGGAVGQADGDPAVAANANIDGFQPLTAALAAQKREQEQVARKPKRTGWAAFQHEAADKLDDARIFLGKIDKSNWLYVDIVAVALVALIVVIRRRNSSTGQTSAFSALVPERAITPAQTTWNVTGKSNRTPKAVVALAEQGNSPAAIARRTGLSLDAVSMLLSMGTLGGRQLQPPTA